MKSLIFICLDSFSDENFKNKKYIDFSNKMLKELEDVDLNTNLNKIIVIISCLEIIIDKKPDTIK